MSIQEQLVQSQAPSAFLYSYVFETPVNVGVLGNPSVQTPTPLSGVGQSAPRPETATVIAPTATTESAEMGWLVRNARALSEYKGEWLLIHGTQLLVHSRNFRSVRAVIRENQIQAPFVYYVPTDDESNSVTV
jgi:hypothetical protein